jgi:hypothetical protein
MRSEASLLLPAVVALAATKLASLSVGQERGWMRISQG